jgi:RNA polymerase sigma-70 factor, ECF subfamily
MSCTSFEEEPDRNLEAALPSCWQQDTQMPAVRQSSQAQCETEDLSNLVMRAQQNTAGAMEMLVGRYQERIAGFVYLLVGQDADLEDICQTVFIKMITGLRKLRAVERFEPWLFQIARNVCFDHLRRLKLRRLFLPFEPRHEQIAAAHENRSRLEEFKRALKALPARQRELILLLEDHEWSYDDLARITRSTVSSVKSRLFRARSELKRRMADES